MTEAIEAKEIKRAVTKNEIRIQHFFDVYKNVDLNEPAVRDYLLEYFVNFLLICELPCIFLLYPVELYLLLF